jgi:hypothetical protein
VACSRGREGIEAFVGSIAGLSQVQNRTGDRKAAVEITFDASQSDRAEAKEPFRHFQRIRAAKEPVEHARTVHLCRQTGEALKPIENDKGQKRSADLQKGAIRSA